MATTPSVPSNPNDAGLAALLAGGQAGAAPGTANSTTATNSGLQAIPAGQAGGPQPGGGVSGGFGTTTDPLGSTSQDTAGHTVITSGQNKISLDPRVSAASTVKQAGTMQVQSPPSTFQDDAIKKSSTTNATKTSVPKTTTVQDAIQAVDGWSDTQASQFVKKALAVGLITDKTPNASQIAQAYAVVVQEASLKGKSPDDLLTQAVNAGSWNSIDPTINPSDAGLSGTGTPAPDTSGSAKAGDQFTSQNSQSTKTINYMDPATAQEALQQTYQRLTGMDPSSKDYQAFLSTLYGYEKDSTAGNSSQRTTTQTLGPLGTTEGGNSASQETDVSQDPLGAGGANFIAEQQAKSSPGYGQYQAATTYFNALIKALSGPGSGLSTGSPD